MHNILHQQNSAPKKQRCNTSCNTKKRHLMNTTPLNHLSKYGQSFWFDNIHRAMLKNGDLKKMIAEDDLRGITSNPSIFEKAITSGNTYDEGIRALLANNSNIDSRAAFFELAIEDVQNAADLLKPVYDKTNGLDGYVSLEVSPDLAHDTEASIKEARDLFLKLDRPNAMIKIPATKAGIPVVEQLIADGININATLLFSVERYLEVAQAYINGIATRQQRGLPINNVNSVASFFVSRVDSKFDSRLEDLGNNGAAEQLKGKTGIANAKLAFKASLELFGHETFKELKQAGANAQRLLWASTGTKNAAYSDVLYIDNLIGENTVNTIPPATAQAFKDHGTCEKTLATGLDEAEKDFSQLNALGVNVQSAMNELEEEGVAIFEKSFLNLIEAIDDKMQSLKNAPPNESVA